MKKQKVIRCATCLALVTLLLVSILTTAFAYNAVYNITYTDKEIKSADYFVSQAGKKILNTAKIDAENMTYINSIWVKSAVDRLINKGVLYGASTSRGDIILTEDMITGKDALALALFYYWPKSVSGYVVAQGSSGSDAFAARKLSYSNAGSLFNTAIRDNNTGTGLGTSIASKISFSRKEAFYIIANCIQQTSSVRLWQFSETKLGYNAGGTVIGNVSFSGGFMITGNTVPVSDASKAQQELSDAGSEYMQATNMLIHCGVLRGRNAGGGVVRFDVNETITYGEFYSLLCTVEDKQGDYVPPEYTDITASLTASGGTDEISYKDLLAGGSANVTGSLNSSASTSAQTITNRKFTLTDSYGNSNTKSQTAAVASFGMSYDNTNMHYTKTTVNGGDRSYNFPFTGQVTITDRLGGAETSSTASGKNTVDVVNYPPTASVTATTDRLSAPYNKLFYYVGEPITLTDGCADYENALTDWYYTIQRRGSTVASSNNFANPIKTESIVSSYSGNFAKKTHSITFAQTGDYDILVQSEDELGKVSTQYRLTITVREAPQPPTAIIRANKSTFANYNTLFQDASTDPNDDIVKWVWDKELMYFDEVMDENGDGTGEGEWIVAPKSSYTGTLNDVTRSANGSYNTAQGTLQFKVYGRYRIGLTVTDATDFTDHTTHEIQVIEDIPIIVVDPQPPQPDLYYTVTFVNTDDSVRSTQVKAGTTTPPSEVPAIVDIAGYFEHGWTMDGTKLIEPTSVVVNGNITFCVLTTPQDEDPNIHTVTFINTDGTRDSVKVPHGGTVPRSEIPAIVDLPDLEEYGWTRDGNKVVDPGVIIVTQDIVFWVQTDKAYVDPGSPEDFLPHYEDDILYVKQNRSAYIDVSNSLNPPSDPIQVDKTEWVIAGIDGYNTENVKWEMTTPGGRLVNQFVPKDVGTFTVTITLHNNYSDKLAVEKPNSQKLTARTATITVVVYPDVDPQASLFVNNANPNFHTNPTIVNVTVASTALSPDYDSIGTYEWVIYRDNNNNGRYEAGEIIYQQTGSNLPKVTFPVQFESGVVGKFKATLRVNEVFGQKTISKFITAADTRYTTAEREFEVNWTPCISCDLKFEGNDWAYVDDTIAVSSVVKDENTSTCTTEWRLRKQTAAGFEYVDTSTLPVWQFNTLGGKLRIPMDGFYSLEAKITDDHGCSETFVSKQIRIYDLPVAVISDTADFRWDGVQWQYKQSRRFDLDGAASYADDKTGPALHQIVHTKDTWTITPLDGGTLDDIYVMADNGKDRLTSTDATIFKATQNEFREKLSIIKPGTYEVSYWVTNSHGKVSPAATQVITIAEDTEPVIDTGNPSSYEKLGSEVDNKYVKIGLTNISVQSDDKDIVGTATNFEANYRYDSNNDGNFEDEVWKPCTTSFSAPASNTSKLQLSVTADVNEVGKYQFRVLIKEAFGQETLPIVPEECRIKREFYHVVEADNTRPHGTFDVTNTVYGDILFAMGSSDNVKEVSEKTLNYANSFGDVEGSSVFQLDVKTIETSSINIADGITWNNSQMSSYIGSVYMSNGGLNVNMAGNRSNPGQNILYSTDFKGNIGFNFNYSLTFGDSFHGAGVCVNLSEDANYIYATMLWMTGGYQPSWSNGIYDIVYRKGSNSSESPYTMSLLQALPLASSGRLELSVGEGKITVTGSGVNNSTYTVTSNKYNGDGFGFYSSHYSHGCDDIGSFNMTNIELEVTRKKSLSSTMTDVSFNSDHDVFIIWTEDTIPAELDKTSPTYEKDYADLVSMLVSQNVHLIVFGSSGNKTVMQSLLNQCLVPGIFIDTGSVEKDLTASREFIASILRQASGANVKYVLVGEETIYTKHYADFNGDKHWFANGTTDSILSSKWWYSQDPDYYLNPLGTIDENKTWLPTELTSFLKTGRYYVDYKVKDNPVPAAWQKDNSTGNPFDIYRYWSNNYGNDEYTAGHELSNPYAEIYVHRRPVAQFDFTAKLSPTSVLEKVTVANSAYDLDHYEEGNPKSRPDKGLQMYEWTWQLANDPKTKTTALFLDPAEGDAWMNTQLAGIQYKSSTSVLITYRVRDIDGTEVEEDVVYSYRMNGDIYLAPASYRHTTLDADLIVGGKKVAGKGTYVTSSYEEAISELRKAADSKMATYQQKATKYNQLEATAVAAEQSRDAKQLEVTNAERALSDAEGKLSAATTILTQYQSNLTTANGDKAAKEVEYNEATSALAQLQSELNALNSSLSSLQTELTALQSQHAALTNALSTLKDDLAVLESVDTSYMTAEELAAHQDALSKKQADITAKQTEVDNKQSAITMQENKISVKVSEVSAKQTATNEKQHDKDAAYIAFQSAVSNASAWQLKVSDQTAAVNGFSTVVTNATAVLNSLRGELSTLTTTATNARTSANSAKSDMDAAKSAWDAAEAAVAAIKPISTGTTAWVTRTNKKMVLPDGAWSQYNTVRVSGNPIPPVAKFTTNKIYYGLKEDVRITDKSYSPNGNSINIWAWQITNEFNKVDKAIKYSLSGAAGTTKVTSIADMEARISAYVTQLVNAQKLGLKADDNTYKITLVVTDNKDDPLESKPYAVSIVLVPENTPPTADPTDKSFYKKNGVLVYAYDPYDASVKNSFYTYNGVAQFRGTETIDWTLTLDDPDNHDSYGTANDSEKYKVGYLTELFRDRDITAVTEDRTTVDTFTYGDFTVTQAEALVNSKLAPFITAKAGNLTWGAYRITTTVTDIPNNGMDGKSVTIKTNNTTPPKHLYVIPALALNDTHYFWSETGTAADPQQLIPVGDAINVTCTTNGETVGVKVKMPNGAGTTDTTDMTLTSTDPDGTKHWSADVVIPNDLEADDLASGEGYSFTVESWTDYGRDAGVVTRTKAVSKSMKVLPLKLYDFNVTDIADPGVGFSGNAVYVPNLAYDTDNSPKSVLMKKGYAFYFEISSKGLRGDNDSISIKPHFYGFNEITRKYDIPLDLYYRTGSGYVLATYTGSATTDDTFTIYAEDGKDVLGSIHEIELDANNRHTNSATQTWTGLYGIPSTSVFTEKGHSPTASSDLWKDRLNKGILVTFDIDAMKNGESKYNYVTRGQWHSERVNTSGTYISPAKVLYQDGAVIVMNGKDGAASDYEARPVWRKSR